MFTQILPGFTQSFDCIYTFYKYNFFLIIQFEKCYTTDLFYYLPLSLPENTSADSLRRVCCRFLEACNKLGGLEGVCDVPAVEVEAEGTAVGLAPDTVLSCSWMSIMWSPSRMLRFRGALPHRNSLTWVSLRDSSACMMPISGRCV